MFQAPARLWNEIAEIGPLRTGWAEQMFPLPAEMMQDAINKELDRVTEETGSPVLAAAYLVTMPLLWEAVAIRNYLAKVGPQGSLPPLETVDDALAVAKGDYPLEPQEVEQLRRMLLVEPQE